MSAHESDPERSPRLIFEEQGAKYRIIVPVAEPGDRAAVVYAALESPRWARLDRRELLRVSFPIRRREARALLFPLGLPEATREAAVKLIRARSIQAAAKRWEQTLPPEIVQWAEEQLAAHMRDEPCVDNCRVARANVSSQVRRFRRQEADGCCGSATFTKIGPDGHKYLFGYNFGH